jgi:hypothetical protein
MRLRSFKPSFQQLIRSAGLLLLLAVVLSACSGSEERLWLKARGWNRAQLIGRTGSADPAPFALDDQGRIYFFLIHTDNELAYPHVIALDRELETIWDYTYDVESSQASKPQIIWDGNDLNLLWLGDQGLYHITLDTAGAMSQEPTLLLQEGPIDSYDAALAPDGQATAWFAGPRRQPGLHAAPLANLGGAAVLVDPLGVRPTLQFDEAGVLHATWAHYPPGYGDNRLYYGAYPDGHYQPGRETLVHSPRLGMATFLLGPWLGLDDQDVYLIWAQQSRTGMEAGKVEALEIHFPPGQVDHRSAPRQLTIPPSYDLAYSEYNEGRLKAGDRVLLEAWGTSHITEIDTLSSQNQELAIAFRTRIDYLQRKERDQVSVLYLQDGAPTSYQLLSFTSIDSQDPAIGSDQNGNLYLTWLERTGEGGYSVYFATTAPDVQRSLKTLTWNDIGRLGAETLFGLVTGALLIPIVLVWLIVPMALIFLTSFLRKDEENLAHPGTLVSFGLSMIAYWAGKLLVLPGIRDYVPFSAWIPFIPGWASGILRVGVPVLIAALALRIAWGLTYRRDRPSALYLLLLYAAIDGVLTTAVYGVIFLAAF